MKKILTSVCFILTLLVANGQDMYIKTFGNKKDKPIVFLHGGPGYNAVNFEATTAQKLADKGFYVIVYDRRGEGRSVDSEANYTFKEAFDDINAIYQQYSLTKATVIGHSFGGVVATLFAEQYPEKINSIILVGAPVSLQQTFKTILATSKAIYQDKEDSANLNYVSMLEKMDTTSIQYSSYCFMHAMQNGFYTPKKPSEEAKLIYSKFSTDTLLIKYASQMSYQAPQGFWKNENYTTIDLSSNLQKLLAQKVSIYGLYGKEDGLYSGEQIKELQHLLGENNLKYLDNCSHNVFIDQQSTFIEQVKTWID